MSSHFWLSCRFRPAIGTSVAAALFLLLSACATPAPEPVPPSVAPAHGPIRVAIIKHGWHTEIAFPDKSLTGPLAGFGPTSLHQNYLIVGFGARSYFPKPNAGMGDAAEALLPGPALVNLYAVNAFTSTDQVTWLDLSQGSVDRMLAFTWDYMSRQGNDAPVPAVKLSNINYFYAARRDYSMFYNCNNWAVDVLKAGGLPFSNSGLHFASDVQAQARRVAGMENAE